MNQFLRRRVSEFSSCNVVSAIYRFHVNLLADPWPAPFACTWEDAAARLSVLPQMIFEPDGSFVFSGDVAAGHRWHVDGQLFDLADRLYRVELRGQCPSASLDALLRCVGWPEQLLVFEMIREGVTLTEAEFRRHAEEKGAEAR